MRRRAKGTAAPHVVQYPYLGQRGLQGHSCLVDQGPCPRLTTPANAEPWRRGISLLVQISTA
jgi:hypothetical protein